MMTKTGGPWVGDTRFDAPPAASGWLRTKAAKAVVMALTGIAALWDLAAASRPLRGETAVRAAVVGDIAWDDAPEAISETLTMRATAKRLLLAAAILGWMVVVMTLVFDIGADTPVNAAGLVSCL